MEVTLVPSLAQATEAMGAADDRGRRTHLNKKNFYYTIIYIFISGL